MERGLFEVRSDRLILFLDLIWAMTEYHWGAGRWPEERMNPRRFSWDRIHSILRGLGWPEEAVKRVSFHGTPSWERWCDEWRGLLQARTILRASLANRRDLIFSVPPLVMPRQLEAWQDILRHSHLRHYEREPIRHGFEDAAHHDRLLCLIAAGEIMEADFKEP